MARIRISGPAQGDLRHILAVSEERWGLSGRSRYAQLIAAALQAIAADPRGRATRARDELLGGLRSLHLRHARERHGVRTPVHVVYYRSVTPERIEIVRILHERMDPTALVAPERPKSGGKRRRR